MAYTVGSERRYAPCALCPRACRADRLKGERGACGETATVRVARAALHMWEEPPISGSSGSGAVFFSGCPLHCVYCQNAELSSGLAGIEIGTERLAEIFLEQQARGALNVNLVTPSHFAPQIVDAIGQARKSGLVIPIVYNTSGYESMDTLDLLKGYINIYLTDFKYANMNLGYRYSGVRDYPSVASRALDAMYAQVGPYTLGPDPRPEKQRTRTEDEVLLSGVVVRHLMLPGHLDDSAAVMRMLAAKEYSRDICVSLMSQYTPPSTLKVQYSELAQTVDSDEYEALVDYALELGLENSFMQEAGSAKDSFIPPFDYEGVL